MNNNSYNNAEQEYIEMYFVVMNHEEQYSIWPDYKEIPLGWKKVLDTSMIKEECLAFIEKNWTDMRPLSLRKEMENSK